MIKPKNPCYGCDIRSAECHSRCLDYKDFTGRNEQYNKIVIGNHENYNTTFVEWSHTKRKRANERRIKR